MKHVTITSVDNSRIGQKSKLIIHTATSVGLIDKIALRITCDNYTAGYFAARQIVEEMNRAIDAGVEIEFQEPTNNDNQI